MKKSINQLLINKNKNKIMIRLIKILQANHL
jgi:hypothetical protein